MNTAHSESSSKGGGSVGGGSGGGGGGATSEYLIGTSGSSGYQGAVFTTRIE